MVIVIKDYEWKETASTISITVPIKNVISSKADIFNSTRYIKVTYEKFLFEVILLYATNVLENKCTITTNQVIFELVKCESLIWGRIEPNITKQEKQQLKQTLIEEEHERLRKELEEKSNQRHELKRVAVQEQISIESTERTLIEEIKKEEKNSALGDIESWSKDKTKTTKIKSKRKENLEPVIKPVVTATKEKLSEPLPEVRKMQSIEISFTPREFPTPCRESRLEEENEWLKKQAQARRTAGFVSEDIRPEERNPLFLKHKGDEFMKTNNYLGAISAYSFGITISSKYADLYVARSGAHFAVGNLHKAIQDCSTALELMKPEVPSNLQERAECIGRRGMALCKIGMLKQGISELKASIRLQTNEDYVEQLKQFELELEKKLDELSD